MVGVDTGVEELEPVFPALELHALKSTRQSIIALKSIVGI